MTQAMAASPSSPPSRSLSPEDAVERFLSMREVDATERTLRSYESRLRRFIEWADANDIERMDQLDSFLVDEYRAHIQGGDRNAVSAKGILATFRVFVAYCEDIGIVEPNLHAAVQVPTLDPHEETSESRLEAADAVAMLRYFRNAPAHYGIDQHAYLEVAWHVGARVGGLRALDLGDYDPDARELDFRHRPSTDTPLKNKRDGERIVGLSSPVADVLDAYIVRERHDTRDDHGREPLFATRQGRAAIGTLRGYSYLATEPCYHMACPHGKRRATCVWTQRNHASKCPSSRSPHEVRSGSIVWQLNEGIPIEVVAERVNSTPGVIRRYYDHAGKRERYEQRRKAIELDLDIGGGDGE